MKFKSIKNSDVANTRSSPWNHIIFVPLTILLLIMAHGFFLDLAPERSEYLKVEKVANETYRQYSQRLDAISKKYAKELEAINKKN